MSYNVGPVNAPDAYPNPQDQTSAGKWIDQCPVCHRVNFTVQTNSIFYQVRRVGSGMQRGEWAPEQYLPGLANAVTFVSLDRLCMGVRFRNAVVGSVAVVSVELVPPEELPPG
jgi:hypothetical protein